MEIWACWLHFGLLHFGFCFPDEDFKLSEAIILFFVPFYQSSDTVPITVLCDCMYKKAEEYCWAKFQNK